MSGLRAGQSMTSTSWSKKAAVSRAVWDGAMSWMYTISIIRPDADINQPLPLLPTAHPTQPSLWYRENDDSSLKIQCLHFLVSHTLCLLPYSRRRRLCPKVSPGHPAWRRNQYPAARSSLRIVRTDIRLSNRRIICIRRRGAEMFVLTIRSSWRSTRGVGNFHRTSTPLLVWSASFSVASQILPMHPWDTLSILATSCWELPSADDLTIRFGICSDTFCGMIPFKSSKKYQ